MVYFSLECGELGSYHLISVDWTSNGKGVYFFLFHVFRAICLKFEVPSASRRFTSVNKKGGLFKNEKLAKNFLTVREFNSLHRETRSKRGE